MESTAIDWKALIIYKDIHLVIVNKPFTVLAQKDKKGEMGVNELLFEHLGKPNFWMMLQRIDRVAGGLMTMAVSKRMSQAMGKLQAERAIVKIYYAITEQAPKEASGRLEQHIRRLPNSSNWKVSVDKRKNSKTAVLEYEQIAQVGERCLLKLRPITGRTHQIRAQLAHMGCPIVGDKKYGKTTWLSDHSICLFSGSISFKHPITGKEVSVQAPFPVEREVWSDFSEHVESVND